MILIYCDVKLHQADWTTRQESWLASYISGWTIYSLGHYGQQRSKRASRFKTHCLITPRKVLSESLFIGHSSIKRCIRVFAAVQPHSLIKSCPSPPESLAVHILSQSHLFDCRLSCFTALPDPILFIAQWKSTYSSRWEARDTGAALIFQIARYESSTHSLNLGWW